MGVAVNVCVYASFFEGEGGLSLYMYICNHFFVGVGHGFL